MRDDEHVLGEWKEKEPLHIDKKHARKLVWRTRVSIGFTVIRVLLLLLLLYVLYMVPVYIIYETTGKSEKFERAVITLVETRHPGFVVQKSSGNRSEISPLLTETITVNLFQKIGDWEVVVGEVQAHKSLFGKLHYTLDFDQKYLNNNYTYTFALAPDLIGEKYEDGGDGATADVKKQLAMIDDGYVAQVHFSTKESMMPKELIALLAHFDLDVLQMAVFAGEFTDVDVGYGKAGQYTFVDSLILRPAILYSDNGRMWYSMLSKGEDLEVSVNQLPKDIEWLIDNIPYDDKEIDRQRLAYLEKHELRVYGATVTGPIRELEKLLRNAHFHQFQLDGIEVWNWESLRP